MAKVPGSRVPGRPALIARLAKVRDLSEGGSNIDALALAQSVAADAAAMGIDSAYLSWVLGVVNDREGELEEALRNCLKSMELDPLDPGTDRSLKIIEDRACATLLRSTPWNPRGWVLYNLLVEHGLASDAVQALAKRVSFQGDTVETTQFASVITGEA
jgi:hypothetical protein